LFVFGAGKTLFSAPFSKNISLILQTQNQKVGFLQLFLKLGV